MSKLADIAKKSLGTQTVKIDEIIEQYGELAADLEEAYGDLREVNPDTGG